LAFLLAIFGSGLGWLQNLAHLYPKIGSFPIDLWLYDAFPFFGMETYPHFAAVICGQLAVVLLFLRYRQQPRWVYPAGMAAAGLLLQAIQPFAPLLPFLLVGGILLGDWITAKTFPVKFAVVMALVTVAQVPLLAYNYWVVSTDPIWRIYASQALTATPSPGYLILGFFWFWLLLIPGLFRLQIFKTPKRIGLLVWVIAAFLLAYVPWQMQRRALFYYTLPLAILATVVIQKRISPWLSRRLPALAQRKNILLFPMLALVGFTNFYLVFVHITFQLPAHLSGYYHPAAIGQAIDWLAEHADQDSVLLSTPETAFLAATQTMQRVFVAHTDETANYQLRLAQVEDVYNNRIDLASLEPANLEWVFFGPYEQLLGPHFQPPPGLKAVYQRDGVTIYEIDGEP
jgi:hypothetical protein